MKCTLRVLFLLMLLLGLMPAALADEDVQEEPLV